MSSRKKEKLIPGSPQYNEAMARLNSSSLKSGLSVSTKSVEQKKPEPLPSLVVPSLTPKSFGPLPSLKSLYNKPIKPTEDIEYKKTLFNDPAFERNFLLKYLDDKEFLKMCILDKEYKEHICDENVFKQRTELRYPLLTEFKEPDETWKQLYIRMTYFIGKLEERFGIPYIPTEGYNPEKFYQEWKNNKYIYNRAMREAAYGGHLELVKNLIAQGACNFDFAMYRAAYGGHLEIVKFFIDQGARHFNRAMAGAARGGHLEIVKYLITQGANNFDWAMEGAARQGHLEIVKYLIDRGARDFNRAMVGAAGAGHTEIVNYLKQVMKNRQ